MEKMDHSSILTNINVKSHNKTNHSTQMNKLFLLLFVALFLISCNQKAEKGKYDKNGKIIVYSEEVYSRMWIKNRNLNVTVIDTFCINQKERALLDIKKGKLIYSGFNNPPVFKKLSSMLINYGIETIELPRRSVRMGGFNPYCYEEEMDKAIDRKYGAQFIDSLVQVAKKEFVVENPDTAYMEDGIDLREKYLKK